MVGQKVALFVVSFLVFSVLAQAASVPIGDYASGIGDDDHSQYGADVEFLTDFNGDGVYDIAVSAPSNDSWGEDSGAVFLFFGPIDEGANIDHDKADMVLTGTIYEDLGTSIAGGDYNGDGLSDLLIGAPGHGDETGRAYIFHGGDTTNRTSQDANATFKGQWMGQKFGQSVANIGNLNGDQYDDFMIGAGGGNSVAIYLGSGALETPMVELPELEVDLPNPADFTSGLNSTGNTFGLGNATDGWDWKNGTYGGTNDDVHFPPLVNQGGTNTDLQVMMGNTTDGSGDVPAGSGGYGVDFNITKKMVAALKAGGELHVRLRWTTRDTPGGGNGLEWWHGECYWVKARFWNSSVNATYLGWNHDGDNNPANDEDLGATTDSTLELFYVDWAWGSNNVVTYSYPEDLIVTDLVDGAHMYYLDVGGKLSDWSTVAESLEVSIDDISIGVEVHPIAELLGPTSSAGYGTVLSGAGDVNKDGYDDILVGAPGSNEVHIYFGGPDFATDFDVHYDWAFPASQGQNDTTFENGVDDIIWNDGGWGSTNWYTVDMTQTMDIDSWTYSDLKGEIVEAYLYIEYKTSAGYNGNNWVRWRIDEGAWQKTDLQPTNTNGQSRYNYNDANGPYPFHNNGLQTLEQLKDLDLEFTNNAAGGGTRSVYFDWAWIYVISQMASNVTIKGALGGELGSSIAGLGNINGDLYDDIVIGDPSVSQERGAAYVFTGGKELVGNLTVDDAFASFTGTTVQEEVGWSVASAGKFSLDDVPDIAVGSKGNGTGTLYVIRGGPAIESGAISEVAQYSMGGDSDGSRFSTSIVAMGDINGRYAGEILVGAPLWTSPSDGLYYGAVYILYNTDEDILEQPLMIEFYPAFDPTINEGEDQDFHVKVNAPEELDVSFDWYLDSQLVRSGYPDYTYGSDFDSAGEYLVRIEVSDGFRSENQEWTLTVLNVNGPPVVEFYPAYDPVLDEGELIRFWTVASDPDGDVLAYLWTLDGVPVSTQADLIFKTDYTMAGHHEINVSVSDHQYTVSRGWDVSVMDVNRPPIITSASPDLDPALKGGDVQRFNISAYDPDGDDLHVIWYLGEDIVATDTYDITVIGEFIENTSINVKVLITDGEFWAQHTWSLTMTGGGPPVIDWYKPESPVHINEGEEVVFWISAVDPDGDELGYEWSLDGTAVDTGEAFTFKPPVDPAREYNLEVVVDEVARVDGYQVAKEWTIIVNRGPEITNYRPDRTKGLNTGETLDLGITFQDPDFRDGDVLTVLWYVNDDIVMVEEFDIFSSAGARQRSDLTVVVPFERVKELILKALVTDGALSDEVSWKFNISRGSDTAPTAVLSYSPSAPKKGDTITFDASASTDLENDIIEYSWSFGDGSTHSGANTTRAWDDKGIYTVTLTVRDSKGNLDTITEVIAIDGFKRTEQVESPWGLMLFLLLLVVFVLLLIYQANRKGWVPSGRRPGERARARPRREMEDEEEEMVPEDDEPDEPEEERPAIEGEFEEIPLEEEEDLD